MSGSDSEARVFVMMSSSWREPPLEDSGVFPRAADIVHTFLHEPWKLPVGPT